MNSQHRVEGIPQTLHTKLSEPPTVELAVVGDADWHGVDAGRQESQHRSPGCPERRLGVVERKSEAPYHKLSCRFVGHHIRAGERYDLGSRIILLQWNYVGLDVEAEQSGLGQIRLKIVQLGDSVDKLHDLKADLAEEIGRAHV